MKSTEFLQAAIDVQAERGKQYDKPTGERSMGATISAFNCITGYTLEESDGWMLLSLLKLVRQSQNPEKYHHDSALDFVAYASLYAEAASEQCGQLEANKQAGEWIKWDGGNCPVSPDEIVDVRHRDGELFENTRADGRNCRDWSHSDEDGDIMEYRLSPTSTAQ